MEILKNNSPVSENTFSENIFNQGINIYEVVRIFNGYPIYFQDNIERLKNSMLRSGITIDVSLDQLPKQLSAYITRNQIENANLKIVYQFYNESFDQYIYQIPCLFPSAADYQNGVATLSMHATRNNPQIKYINLSLRQEADKIMETTGVYETILIDENGCVTEGSRSNVLFFDNQRIYSAPFAEILPGTTRKRVAEICKEQGIEIVEQKIPFISISQYDACCITSTGPLVLPVNRIDNIKFNPQNPLLQRLVKLYFEKIRTIL